MPTDATTRLPLFLPLISQHLQYKGSINKYLTQKTTLFFLLTLAVACSLIKQLQNISPKIVKKVDISACKLKLLPNTMSVHCSLKICSELKVLYCSLFKRFRMLFYNTASTYPLCSKPYLICDQKSVILFQIFTHCNQYMNIHLPVHQPIKIWYLYQRLDYYR